MKVKMNLKQKLKPAKKYVSSEKVKEAKEDSSFCTSTPNELEHASYMEEQSEDADIIVPVCQSDSKPPDVPDSNQVASELSKLTLSDISLNDFCIAMETTLITTLDNRAEAMRKAREEKQSKMEAEGITVITPDNALVKCAELMKALLHDCNLYKSHEGAIDRQQAKSVEIAKQQGENAKRLETIIGRIEKVQGVKAPRRPPFPSWACLVYLLWHWPMYAFAYLWLSKYFRRFCFLIAFFVIVLEFCLICFLANENSTLKYEHDKYVTVRNWSYVMDDTSAMNRFNKVDLLFEDVKFNEERIRGLNEFIRNKNEQNLKRSK